MNKFYLLIGEATQGPFSPHQVRQMLADGEITSETQWSREGGEEWQPVSKMLMPAYEFNRASGSEQYVRPAASRDGDEQSKVRDRAWLMSTLGIICSVMAGLGVVGALALGGSSLLASLAGGFLALGLCLVAIAQLMHIRAALVGLTQKRGGAETEK